MKLLAQLDRTHQEARQNLWLHYFSIFTRIVLAIGFIPAGFVKIYGERFASGLSVIHPMGHYLEALHFTGYYYTFIGVAQVLAGLLLLIPRTVLLGALLYFPIILNICILSFAVRFDGSLLTSPLMVMANLFLFFWHYDRLKFILPFKSASLTSGLVEHRAVDKKFPWKFFMIGAILFFAVVASVITMNTFAVMPRNHIKDCERQFLDTKNKDAGNTFCECIHVEGKSFNECLKAYDRAVEGARGIE